MCRICEGATHEELIEESALAMSVYGYTMHGVGDDDHAPWVYTTGLLDNAGHPELIVAGPKPETCVPVLAELADAVMAGETFEPGDRVPVGAGYAEIGAVDDVQYELSTFNQWHELYAAGELHDSPLQAVQVILGPMFFCEEHRVTQPVLADPDARVGEIRPRPNRAVRRARRHRH